MRRILGRLVAPVLAALLQLSPAPLAAQLRTDPLPTSVLYQMARERATAVNDRCVGALSNYLEAVGYMYAYLQAAGREGSLQSDPGFTRTFVAQFNEVLSRAQRCLKAYPAPSAASGMSGGAAWEAPGPGVNLTGQPPLPPAPGALAPAQAPPIATDAQGRTIPQLLAEIDRLNAEWVRQANELQRLRNTQPAPPNPASAQLGVEYRIRVKADGHYWHLDGNGDNLLSTRYQTEDDFTRFVIEGRSLGAYRIRNKATGRYLYVNEAGTNYVISSTQSDTDDHTAFLFWPQADGTYRITNRGTGRFLHEDGLGGRLVTTLFQGDDDFTHFVFVP